MDIAIIGNPENRRVNAFIEAANRMAGARVMVLPYIDWLLGNTLPAIPPGSILKIDSPGENALVRKLLIERGSNQALPELQEHGIIQYMHAWYLGYNSLLQEIETRLPVNRFRWMNPAADILLMFNKPACQRYLQQNGIPVPVIFTGINHYDQLVAAMQQQRKHKVFVKPAHSSSASGVIAFRKSGDKVQAITSAEMVRTSSGLQLYNSLKVRTYTQEHEVTALINTILAEKAQVEEWLPKATLEDRYFDIRVLVIAGRARHTVIRTSTKVITNLHLGNKRGNIQTFLNSFGEQKLVEVKQIAEQTAACFPRSLYMGIDLLITAGKGNVYVLEVNAFGDLLPGLIDENETCYEAEITAAATLQEEELC